MIVDSSVIVALLKPESDAAEISDKLGEARGKARMSAATYLETSIVVDRYIQRSGRDLLEDLIADFEIEIVPFTPDQARIARQAYRDFGRGSGHSARLNFGDCFAYALASETGEPLLFKGEDFTHTGIGAA